VDVVRDLLDQPVVDRHGREMGRVDGIILEQHRGEPPRLSALVIGPAVLGYRVHPTVGRWVAAIEQAVGVAEGRPVRIDCRDVTLVEGAVTTAVAIGETAAGSVENRLRKWLLRIPGAQ
jgi:sporulation protein YlmC with PRC-barrel domain